MLQFITTILQTFDVSVWDEVFPMGMLAVLNMLYILVYDGYGEQVKEIIVHMLRNGLPKRSDHVNRMTWV